jgi:protein-tyrosine kinase
MRRTIVGKRPHAELQHLIYTVFQRARKTQNDEGVCIVFTSALHNEGVSYVVRRLGQELARHDDKNTLIIDSGYLQKLTPVDLDQIALSGRRDSNRYCVLTSDSADTRHLESSPWKSDRNFREQCLSTLKKVFDYVLIDCSPVGHDATAASLAPISDGVVLVVEAGRTRRNHIQFSEQILRSAHGKVVGYVLNKRRYLIPDWLYARL